LTKTYMDVGKPEVIRALYPAAISSIGDKSPLHSLTSTLGSRSDPQ
jgi:hypothetical protein